MSSAGPRAQYVETRLGVIHAVCAGAGRPVLLLHQTPRSVDEYRDVIPRLARDFSVVAMDTPGFGASPPPAGAAGAAGWAGCIGCWGVCIPELIAWPIIPPMPMPAPSPAPRLATPPLVFWAASRMACAPWYCM